MMNRSSIRLAFAALLACCSWTSVVQAQEPNLSADVVVLHKIRTQQDQPGDLAFLNLASGKVVARVPVGREPHEVAVSSDGKYALATNTGANSNPGNTLSLIDLKTRKELRRVDLGPLRSPHGVWYQGGLFYFTAEGAKAIGAYNPATDHLDWIIGTGQDTTHNLVVSRDGTMIFTANRGSHTVTMLEPTLSPQGAAAWRTTLIPVCRSPQGLDLSPDGKTLWVGCRGSNEMAIISAAEKKVVTTFPTQTGQLARVRFTPDGKRVLAADLGRGELTIWDAASHQELKRLKLGSYAEGILITPDGKHALIGVTTDDNIAEIDLQTLEITRRIQTGLGPDGMAWIGPK
jgi:DNA-binding beta-propeller fold protein YncE